MNPGINLLPQQPVMESEILLSCSGLSTTKNEVIPQNPSQQQCALSSRDVAEHFKCYRIFSDSCFPPVHSKTQSQKEDNEIVTAVPVSFLSAYSSFFCSLQGTT